MEEPEPPKRKEKKQPPPRASSVFVEAATSDDVYRVDMGSRTCSCSAKSGSCFHVRRAVDAHEEKLKSERFNVVSAMHKEIRRGNVEGALYWADLLSRHSDYYVKNYVRQICGEEVRNYKYFRMCLEPRDYGYRDMVAAIASSRKKWEHPKVCGIFKDQMRGWIAAKREIEHLPSLEAVASEAAGNFVEAVESGKRIDAFREFWILFEAKESEGEENDDDDDDDDDTEEASQSGPPIRDVWEEFDDRISRLVEHRGIEIEAPSALLKAFPCTGRDQFELRVGLIEALFGGWDSSMNDFPHGGGEAHPYADGSTLRRYPDYVFDKHTMTGKNWLSRWLGKLRPEQPQPGRLDMRWSGQFYGVSWRYAAFAQYGAAYVDKAWEQVRWTPEFWDLTVSFDEE